MVLRVPLKKKKDIVFVWSALHRPPVLRGPVRYDRVQRRALLADAAPRGDEVRVAALVRERVGRAPRGHAAAEHVLPPLPLLLRFQPLAMLLNLREGERGDRAGEHWPRERTRRPGAAAEVGGSTRECGPDAGLPRTFLRWASLSPFYRWGNGERALRGGSPGLEGRKWGTSALKKFTLSVPRSDWFRFRRKFPSLLLRTLSVEKGAPGGPAAGLSGIYSRLFPDGNWVF